MHTTNWTGCSKIAAPVSSLTIARDCSLLPLWLTAGLTSTVNQKGQADRWIVASKIDALANRMPLHELVMFKRDKFIAHADWVARPINIVKVEGRIVDRHTPVPIVREGLEDLAEFRTLITEVAMECAKIGYIADLLLDFNTQNKTPPADAN
jgi:hypothetical protein